VLALVVLQSAQQVAAHGAVTYPPPRNGVDRDTAPWNGPVPMNPPDVDKPPAWCPVTSKEGKLSGQNAQACFWFSNGCAVGCPKCDGSSRGPIPGVGNGSATSPPTGIGRNKVGPNGVVCQPEEATGDKPTMCDPLHRSINTGAECGGPLDWYYFSPWRAPGLAPVFDPCGVAGGHKYPNGPFGGVYYNTTHASLGDYGSAVLPVTPSGTVWKAGSTVPVSWTIEANHGGGYQYRLAARTSERLTEQQFQKMPLVFKGQQGLRWGGGPKLGGSEIFFNATEVATGVVPAGYGWRRNPIPILGGSDGVPGPMHVPSFPPPCKNHSWCTNDQDGYCSGLHCAPEIVDFVEIPANLPAGEYVLGWRWDCEQSTQIWQSCSDVTIVK